MKKLRVDGLVGPIDSVVLILTWMVIPILMIGGFHTRMDLQMLSLMMRVNGTIPTMTSMLTISNTSMEKLGERLGEETVA